MTSVFVDTLYWIAIVLPNDPWRDAAEKAHGAIREAKLVTTDEVLIEFLSSMSKGSAGVRRASVLIVREILTDPKIYVVSQSRKGFMAGISLF